MVSARPYPFDNQRDSRLDVSAHVVRLPSGKYVGFISYLAPGEVGPSLESFRAGIYDERETAHAAAHRLLATFLESVVPPDCVAS